MSNFTEQAIKTTFIKLLNKQPLNKITVKNIVEECGINRNSFYYHFQDIPTLMEEIIKENVDNLIAKYSTISSFEECFTVAFNFALENKQAMKHIYNSVNRDIYEAYSMKLCEYVVTNYLNTVFGNSFTSEYDKTVAIRFLKCELFGLSIDWINNGMKDDAIDEIKYITKLCHGFSDEIIKRSASLEKNQL